MKQRSIQYNFIMNFILTSSSILFPLITFPYVSSILQPAGTGQVAFATSYVSYFTMIAMMGIPTYGIRAVARVRDDPAKLKTLVCELLLINIVMGLFAYALFFISLFLIPQLAAQKALMLVCSLALWLNVFGVSWFYQGLEQYTYITWISIAFKIIAIVMMFALIHNSSDILSYGWMTVISSFGSGLVNFFMLHTTLRQASMEPLKPVRHIKGISTFFAMTIATTIYTNLDTVMLGMMKGDYETGLYNAAIRIKSLLVMLVTSLGTVLLPRLSVYIAQNKKQEFNEVVAKALSFVFLFSVPVSLFSMVYAGPILRFISDASYLPAIPAMVLLMPTLLLIGLSNVTGIQVLVPSGKERQVLYSVSAGAVLDLAINWIMIPGWGAAGAALGTLLAEALVLVWQVVVLWTWLLPIWKQVEFKQLFICLLFFIPGLYVSVFLSPLAAFWQICLGGLLAFSLYGIGLWLSKEKIFMQFLSEHGPGKG